MEHVHLTVRNYFATLHWRGRVLTLALIVGLLCGIVAVLYEMVMDFVLEIVWREGGELFKEKFGDGYTVKIVSPQASAPALKTKVAEVLPRPVIRGTDVRMQPPTGRLGLRVNAVQGMHLGQNYSISTTPAPSTTGIRR